MTKFSKQICIAVIIFTPCICAAANDCNAAVTKKGQTKIGAGWTLEFNVKTSCENSTGRFSYSYIDDNHKIVERSSPNWTSSDGKSFVLKDEIAEPGGIRSITVKNGSIESTKVP